MGNKDAAAEKAQNSPGKKKKPLFAVRIIGWSVAVSLLLYFALKSFLATQYAAGLASGYLGVVLQQRVTVTAISLSGMTLSVRGITLANPEGFAGGPLATARLLRIRPDVAGLLAGKRSFSLVQADGLKVIFGKNPAGEWNCGRIIRLFSRKKKRPAAELFIGRLDLKDVSLNAGGLSLANISLTLHDLSTKGMADSKLVLTGADGKGNPFRLAAEGRLGKNPDIHLSLVAPVFSLAALGNLPKGKPVLNLVNATAALFISSAYRSGDLTVNGHLACNRLGIVVKRHETPLRGILDFSGRYSAARDEAGLDRFSLTVNDAVRVNASGSVLHTKVEKDFKVYASSNGIRLKDILSVFPRETIGETAVNGSLTCTELHLVGNGNKGITSGGGRFLLRNGEVARSGRPLFQGVNSDMAVSRTAVGWNIGGTLAMNARAGKVPLEHLDARFASRFSNAFKLQSVEIPVLKAEVRGVPVHGQLTYDPGKADPYRCALTAKNAPLAPFNDFIGTKNFAVSGGTADISLQASGRGPASFSGAMKVRLSGINGAISGKNVSLGNGEITSRFGRSDAEKAAAGTAVFNGGSYAGSNFSGSFAYTLSDGGFSLSGGKTVINRLHVGFADIRGRIPVREITSAGTRYPLKITAGGLDIETGETRIDDLSGTMEGFFAVGVKSRGLEGNAVLNVPSVSLRGKPLGFVKAQVALAGGGAVAKLNGTALDGALDAAARFEPFALKKGISFKGTVRDAQAAKLSDILPQRFRLKFPAGQIIADLEGDWSSARGLNCGIEGTGKNLTLAVKGGKTIIDGAGLAARVDLAGGNMTVKNAVIRKGEGAVLKISGGLAHVASPSREGKFFIELEKKPVNPMLNSLSTLLPGPLKEATGGGSLGLRGTLGIGAGKTLLEGSMQFDNVLLDFPSHKMSITGVGGVLPFSLYLSGGSVSKPAEDITFSRDNYPRLLGELQRKAKAVKKGELLKIGKIQFGPLEMGDINVSAISGDGLVEITSMTSTLYSGTVIGSGFMFYRGGFNYGADLLINDMSLRQFCSSYPALKGYISGKLDGVVSLYGGKGGIPAMVGFADLWARKGKDEKMLVSKEFLQRLAGRKLKGFFFQNDRPYDNGEISAYLLNGYLTFEKLNLSHTNILGLKDLNVSVAPVQNMIGLSHLFQTIREAAKRGKPAAGAPPAETPVQPDVKWLE